MTGYLQTGQRGCFDARGCMIPCQGTGQDGEFQKGIPWPTPRFEAQGDVVLDHLTGLVWTRRANAAEFPLTWQEALDFTARMNRERTYGHDDWRLPNRRELRSLVSHGTKNPALPEGHPFDEVFLGWYWTSTSAAIHPAHAWTVHMEGARMFYGGKDQSYLVWPVRGESPILPATGQTRCFDVEGNPIPCEGTGQDGEFQKGIPWPRPRFKLHGLEVIDRLTGLAWRKSADLAQGPVSWEEALAAVKELGKGWRLPNINELESLVDADASNPALPPDAPFEDVRETYWSSTTSAFEPDWAFALYLEKGAVGVGQKPGRHFFVWAVRDALDLSLGYRS